MAFRKMSGAVLAVAGLALGLAAPGRTQDPPRRDVEPQTSGWPLTDAERAYVLRPEHERRPGSETGERLPHLWPVVPSAGFWGGTAWLDAHARLVAHVAANRGPVDFLLVGDSITQQWGSPLDDKPMNAAWRTRFGNATVVNVGIGGDKSQNVLWRLDHGAVEGLEPRCVVLMIGNNNQFFVPETGVEAAALGVKACADNLRRRFPGVPIVVVKILPAHDPGNPFHENVRKTNAALDPLRLERDPALRVLDLTSDLLHRDGTLRSELYAPDKIHLSDAGYAVYAARLRPVVDALRARVRK